MSGLVRIASDPRGIGDGVKLSVFEESLAPRDRVGMEWERRGRAGVIFHTLNHERLGRMAKAGVVAKGLHQSAGVLAGFALNQALRGKVFFALWAPPGSLGAVRHVAAQTRAGRSNTRSERSSIAMTSACGRVRVSADCALRLLQRRLAVRMDRRS